MIIHGTIGFFNYSIKIQLFKCMGKIKFNLVCVCYKVLVYFDNKKTGVDKTFILYVVFLYISKYVPGQYIGFQCVFITYKIFDSIISDSNNLINYPSPFLTMTIILYTNYFLVYIFKEALIM